MIPPSLFAGAETFLPVQGTTPAAELPAPSTDEAPDFSSYFSNALDASQPNASWAHPETSPSAADANATDVAPPDDTNSGFVTWSDSSSENATTRADASDDRSQEAQDRKRPSGGSDTSADNNVASLVASSLVPTPKPDQPTPQTVAKAVGDAGATPAVGDSGTGDKSASARGALASSTTHVPGALGKTLAAGVPNLSAALKQAATAAEAAKDSPSPASTSPAPTASATETAKASTQAALLQTIASLGAEANRPANAAGTTGALDTQTMKSNGQKTENTGRTVQKLPSASSSGNPSAGSNGPASGQLGTTGSGRKTDWTEVPSTFDLTIPMAPAEMHDSASLAAGANDAASHAERVANFISQEALTIRLSGATNLAVSLKLDQQTELFVQLTNHNGQIQASLRCERGSLAGLDGHWGQLQESLSRQNIQLLPPEDRTFSRGQSGSYSDASGSRDSQQPSQNQQPEMSTVRSTDASLKQTGDTAAGSGTQGKNSPGGGWESWA